MVCLISARNDARTQNGSRNPSLFRAPLAGDVMPRDRGADSKSHYSPGHVHGLARVCGRSGREKSDHEDDSLNPTEHR